MDHASTGWQGVFDGRRGADPVLAYCVRERSNMDATDRITSQPADAQAAP
jgi:hypothetical protein